MSIVDRNILSVSDLKKYYSLQRSLNPLARTPKSFIRAVDGVTLSVPKSQTSALIGESGCGKSTFARVVALLTPPTSGRIVFDGIEIRTDRIDRRNLYRQMQMVFQDPESSLDPTLKIFDLIAEPIRGLMGERDEDSLRKVVEGSMESVGLSSELQERRPRQISGGQKQRVAIARAIAIHPKLVLLDEPTSALDASVQAQIIQLLLDLQKKLGLTYLLITHNLAVASYMSETVAVMYSGNIVEYGPTDSVTSKPRHPYTMLLMAAAPVPDPWKRNILRVDVKGEVPSAINPPSGCKFNPRCPYAQSVCREVKPELREISQGHFVACHRAEEIM